MESIASNQTFNNTLFTPASEKSRQAYTGDQAEVFAEVFQENSNIIIWERELSKSLKTSVSHFIQAKPSFQTSLNLSPNNALANIKKEIDSADEFNEVGENIAELVDMFCYLFALKRAGLRLAVLQHAMCPKFHVDKVPCRLVTTYQGIATEWLSHDAVNRAKLGMGSKGKPDSQSGLYQNAQDVQQLKAGDVALLKGELWEGNQNAGLVHRSPTLSDNENRLLLTLDFSD